MSKNQPLLVIWWPSALKQACFQEAADRLPVRYAVLASGGETLHGGQESLSKLPKNLPCLVLVNPSEVGLFAVVPPSKLSGKQFKQALPFLVEPFLLNQPEENHVSLWPQLPMHAHGAWLAAVLSKARARSIVEVCLQQGLALAGLSCETLREGLINQSAAWRSDQEFLLVDGVDVPWAVPTTQPVVLKVMLARRVQQAKAGFIELSTEDRSWLNTLLGSDGVESCKTQVTDCVPIEPLNRLLCKNLVDSDALRKMGVRTLSAQSRFSQLYSPALALIVVAVLGLNALAFKADRACAAIQVKIAQAYAQILPNTPMIADPLLLIEREKRLLSAGLNRSNAQGLSALLHETGLAMSQADFNSLIGFSWTDNRLTMRFNANVTEKQQNEILEQFQAKGLEAQWLHSDKSNLPTLQLKKGANQ